MAASILLVVVQLVQQLVQGMPRVQGCASWCRLASTCAGTPLTTLHP
tara:strand:+ start:795 stop:935 length:141 start_codon:yes stop_codon:yes gene_type:complete